MAAFAPPAGAAVIVPDRSIDVILPAAGKSRRFAAERKKIFSSLGGQMVWSRAAAVLRSRSEVDRVVIAIDPDDRPIWESECADDVVRYQIDLVDGGSERVDSVRAALDALASQARGLAQRTDRWIAIHDAARPLITDKDLAAVFLAARDFHAALLACRIRGTVKVNAHNALIVDATMDRSRLWEALTPQVFRADILYQAFDRWNGYPVTDDAQLVERSGFSVRLVDASPTNIKITVPDDLKIAEALLHTCLL